MFNGKYKHGKGGREDIKEMLRITKEAEAKHGAATSALKDPERQAVMKMQKRIFKDYNTFSSFTAELQVLFLKQRPKEEEEMYNLSSSFSANSFWDSEAEAYVMHYGIVYSSAASTDKEEEDWREVIIALSEKGALISFSCANSTDDHFDGPYLLQKANLELLSALAEWLMRQRSVPPVKLNSMELTRFISRGQPDAP